MQDAFVKTDRKLEWWAKLQKNKRASSTLVRTISNTGARPEQSKKPNTRMDALCRKREKTSQQQRNERNTAERESGKERERERGRERARERESAREREREGEKVGSTKDENAVARTVKASAGGNASPSPEDTLSRPTPPGALFNTEHENERHRQRRERLFAQLSPQRVLM